MARAATWGGRQPLKQRHRDGGSHSGRGRGRGKQQSFNHKHNNNNNNNNNNNKTGSDDRAVPRRSVGRACCSCVFVTVRMVCCWVLFVGVLAMVLSVALPIIGDLMDLDPLPGNAGQVQPPGDASGACFEDRIEDVLAQRHSKYSVPDDGLDGGAAAVPVPVSPGEQLAAAGVRKKHPIVIVPGITSTGLEVWQAKRCMKQHFRKRLWGEVSTMKLALLNPACFLEHLLLNATTGLDPDGVKLRAARGLHAADVLLDAYSLWSVLLENAASLGYDENSIELAAYDWRLAYPMLEHRDRYFTQLKLHIERMKLLNDGEKVIVVCHSMGANVYLYFMQWVSAQDPQWVDAHVHTFVNVAGPLLGVPKALSSVLSGEMRDTADIPPCVPRVHIVVRFTMSDSALRGCFWRRYLAFLKEMFMSGSTIRDIFRAFYSVSGMLPMGGDKVWGDGTSDPPDQVASDRPYSGMLTVHQQVPRRCYPAIPTNRIVQFGDPDPDELVWPPLSPEGPPASESEACLRPQRNMSVDAAMTLLRHVAPEYTAKLDTLYSFNATQPAPSPSPEVWSNPLANALPHAPNMTILCVYGVGRDTERAYHYSIPDKASEMPGLLTHVNDGPGRLKHGVQLTDGDGTVPLMSLGFMCAKGWLSRRRNPSRMCVPMPCASAAVCAQLGPQT